ncbi:MAG: Serine/threonine protein kinase related protein, partial [Planctomycetota bacterium]
FVCGRSSFLDQGMRYMRLDPRTGTKLSETVMDHRDPETGEDIQVRLKTLQMPVGLNDLLSSDGEFIYLRSQKFDAQGKRIDIGPISGNAEEQGGTQKGPGRHLFAPMGYLDDSWFHRSYWVYGKNFAGGHNGYYQAGKYTPSGRIMVFNDKDVFGYARQPQYYRWTTTLEHQLFSANRDAAGDAPAPGAGAKPGAKGKRAAGDAFTVSFEKTNSLDPTNKPLTVEAWVKADAPAGVIVAHGGPTNGYALSITGRKPSFHVRAANELATVTADVRLPNGWCHLAGVLGADKSLKLYVNGKLQAKGATKALIAANPAQPLEIGGDNGGSVGDYKTPSPFVGAVDELRIFHRELTAAELTEAHDDPAKSRRLSAEAFVALTFDNGAAKDESGHNNDGDLNGQPTGQGRVGTCVLFPKLANAPAGNTKPGGLHFEHQWTQFSPVFCRSMVLGKDSLLYAGPPDILDEEYAFERQAAKDPAIQDLLQKQDDALEGKLGFQLFAVSLSDGRTVSDVKFDSTPVWDGMTTAYGRIFVATIDGKVLCLGR